MLNFGDIWVIWESCKKLSTDMVYNSANSEPILGVPININLRFWKSAFFWFKHKPSSEVWAGSKP